MSMSASGAGGKTSMTSRVDLIRENSQLKAELATARSQVGELQAQLDTTLARLNEAQAQARQRSASTTTATATAPTTAAAAAGDAAAASSPGGGTLANTKTAASSSADGNESGDASRLAASPERLLLALGRDSPYSRLALLHEHAHANATSRCLSRVAERTTLLCQAMRQTAEQARRLSADFGPGQAHWQHVAQSAAQAQQRQGQGAGAASKAATSAAGTDPSPAAAVAKASSSPTSLTSLLAPGPAQALVLALRTSETVMSVVDETLTNLASSLHALCVQSIRVSLTDSDRQLSEARDAMLQAQKQYDKGLSRWLAGKSVKLPVAMTMTGGGPAMGGTASASAVGGLLSRQASVAEEDDEDATGPADGVQSQSAAAASSAAGGVHAMGLGDQLAAALAAQGAPQVEETRVVHTRRRSRFISMLQEGKSYLKERLDTATGNASTHNSNSSSGSSSSAAGGAAATGGTAQQGSGSGSGGSGVGVASPMTAASSAASSHVSSPNTMTSSSATGEAGDAERLRRLRAHYTQCRWRYAQVLNATSATHRLDVTESLCASVYALHTCYSSGFEQIDSWKKQTQSLQRTLVDERRQYAMDLKRQRQRVERIEALIWGNGNGLDTTRSNNNNSSSNNNNNSNNNGSSSNGEDETAAGAAAASSSSSTVAGATASASALMTATTTAAEGGSTPQHASPATSAAAAAVGKESKASPAATVAKATASASDGAAAGAGDAGDADGEEDETRLTPVYCDAAKTADSGDVAGDGGDGVAGEGEAGDAVWAGLDTASAAASAAAHKATHSGYLRMQANQSFLQSWQWRWFELSSDGSLVEVSPRQQSDKSQQQSQRGSVAVDAASGDAGYDDDDEAAAGTAGGVGSPQQPAPGADGSDATADSVSSSSSSSSSSSLAAPSRFVRRVRATVLTHNIVHDASHPFRFVLKLTGRQGDVFFLQARDAHSLQSWLAAIQQATYRAFAVLKAPSSSSSSSSSSISSSSSPATSAAAVSASTTTGAHAQHGQQAVKRSLEPALGIGDKTGSQLATATGAVATMTGVAAVAGASAAAPPVAGSVSLGAAPSSGASSGGGGNAQETTAVSSSSSSSLPASTTTASVSAPSSAGSASSSASSASASSSSAAAARGGPVSLSAVDVTIADKAALRKQNERLLRENARLVETVRRRNRTCSDCGQRDPDWVSLNLAVVICIRCAGVHRSCGVRVSKVRCLSLDAWQDEASASALSLILALGNERMNALLCAERSDEFAPQPKPDAKDKEREQFIHMKYIDKAFLSKRVLRALAPQPAQQQMQLLRAARGCRLKRLVELCATGIDINCVYEPASMDTPAANDDGQNNDDDADDYSLDDDDERAGGNPFSSAGRGQQGNGDDDDDANDNGAAWVAGRTPLHMCAGSAHAHRRRAPVCVEFLLQNGARVDIKDADNRTAGQLQQPPPPTTTTAPSSQQQDTSATVAAAADADAAAAKGVAQDAVVFRRIAMIQTGQR